jgi:hypothetical protein
VESSDQPCSVGVGSLQHVEQLPRRRFHERGNHALARPASADPLCERLRPAEQLADPVPRLPRWSAIAGFDLPVIADAHAEAPCDLTDREAGPPPILFEHRGEHRHGRTLDLGSLAEVLPERHRTQPRAVPLLTALLAEWEHNVPEERGPRDLAFVVAIELDAVQLAPQERVPRHASNDSVRRWAEESSYTHAMIGGIPPETAAGFEKLKWVVLYRGPYRDAKSVLDKLAFAELYHRLEIPEDGDKGATDVVVSVPVAAP